MSRLLFAGLVVAATLVFAPDASAQFCSSPSYTFTGSTHTINFCGVKYDFPNAGESTWFYCVGGDVGGGVHSISHWNIAMSACLQGAVIDAGEWADDDSIVTGLPTDDTALTTTSTTLGVDGSTGIDGLKFNDTFDEKSPNTKYRYVTFDENFAQSTWAVTVKAGSSDFTAPAVDGPDPACTSEDLPVELGSFEAILDDGDVVLTWTTLSETDNASFSIEQSQSDNIWTEVAFVGGAGTTREPVSYSYRVTDAAPGVNRFRLKQIDFDGAFVYSALVEVTVELPGTHLLSQVYPNPFNPQTRFSLIVSREQTVQINMYDALGRHIRSLFRGNVEANVSRTFLVGSDGLPSGTYMIGVAGETFRDTRILTLLK